MAIGDLDDDGDADLAAANCEHGSVSVLMNHGDGTFAEPLAFDAGEGPCSVAIADLDGDGDLELAVADEDGDNITILPNQMKSPLPCPADLTGDGMVDMDDIYIVLGYWGYSGVPADINQDGVVDLDDLFEVLDMWGPCP